MKVCCGFLAIMNEMFVLKRATISSYQVLVDYNIACFFLI